MSADLLDIARAVVIGGDRSDEGDRTPDDTDLPSLPSLGSHRSVDAVPWFAILMEREPFTSRDGRRFERWSFVTWVRDGDVRHPHEVIGITGTSGRRRSAWQRAISESGYCRVLLEERWERLAVAQVLPVSRLSHVAIAAYADEADAAYEADAESVDLLNVARQIFDDMLEETP